jgi:hypothetical protein
VIASGALYETFLPLKSAEMNSFVNKTKCTDFCWQSKMRTGGRNQSPLNQGAITQQKNIAGTFLTL